MATGHFSGLPLMAKLSKFCVLPFGISLAPRTFTRCMDTVLGPLRRQGLRVINYLDDWLICAQTEQQFRRHVQMLSHIQDVGLCINDKKCSLQPAQTTQFLGMWLDARTGLVRLTRDRRDSLSDCLAHFRLGTRVTWRLCLRLLGLMAAAVQVVPLALLHMWPVQRCLFSLGLCQQRDLRAMVLVTRRLCVALRWWKVPGNISRGSRLGLVLCRQVISVDASLELDGSGPAVLEPHRQGQHTPIAGSCLCHGAPLTRSTQ